MSTTEKQPVTRTILARLPIPALPGWESRTVLLDYAPSARSQPHTHPTAGINYIIQGSIWSQWEDEAEPTLYKQGDVFLDHAEKLHTRIENASAEERLLVVVTYVIREGEANVKFPEQG